MNFNTKAASLAAGLAVSVMYTLCVVAVAVAPDASTRFMSYVTHLDLTSLARPLTWGSYCAGLITFFVYSTVLVAIFGWLYNKIVRGRGSER